MPSYRRTVTIVDAPDGLGRTKLVEVTVSYRPVVGFGVRPPSARFASRPSSRIAHETGWPAARICLLDERGVALPWR